MPSRTHSFLLLLLLLGALARPGAAQRVPSGWAPVQDPANGHWYQAVRVAGAITWDDAKAAAASLTYASFPGHLVAITSAAENQFLVSQILPLAPDVQQWWLGGYQDGSAADYVEPAGGWRWVTGEPWSYTNWYPGEPNNYGGNEDALEYHQAKGWNDYPRGSGLGGYIVEYEPTPIDTGPLLAIQPNPVVGGQSATGTITLAQPAGLGGVVVSLTSSDPAAAVAPASLTVPTGANSFSFPVVTFAVGQATTVTIRTSGAAGTATATLQVVPPPASPAPPATGPSLPPGQQAAGPPVYDPANGHWYQLVRAPGPITWPDARNAAQSLSYAGDPGHLVTVTSAAEEQFVVGHLLGGFPDSDWWWMGGYQDTTAPDYREPAGGWRWVTGEPWSYTDWRSGQPDNNGGNEHFLGYFLDKKWNDFAQNIGYGVVGYVVEYEPAVSPAPAGSGQLLLFPNPVPGGLLALGQVTLPQPAGPGGAIVTLASSNPAAAVVPASVAVLPGASAATFVVVTLPVAAPTSVQITAGGAVGSATAALQVVPLTATPSAASGPNLLVNGGFEMPVVPAGHPNMTLSGMNDLPGWRLLRGTVDVVPSLPSDWQPAPDGGRQSLDLVGTPGAATIEQTFATEPGRDYVFSGWVSHNWGIPEGRANVSLNGVFFVQLYQNVPNSAADMHWTYFTYPFRATASTTTLTIADVTNLDPVRGTALDGLSVTLAPDQNPAPPTPATTTAVTPAAPAALSAHALSSTQIALFWRDTSSNETAFTIWRRDRQHDWAQVGVAAPNATTFTDNGLTPGTVYNYRVRAINGTAASGWSNTVTVRTPGGL